MLVTRYEEEDHNESNHICAGIEAKGWDRRMRREKKYSTFDADIPPVLPNAPTIRGKVIEITAAQNRHCATAQDLHHTFISKTRVVNGI
jgi:hypothetical protein